jgi:hypothetical protein
VGIVIEVRNPGNAVGLFPFIGQPHEPFSGLLHAASEPDEAMAGFS